MNRYCIFIPCYKAENTIKETLAYLQESLNEVNIKIPVYIYDDGSGDTSMEIARNSWKMEIPLILNINLVNSGERRTTNKAFEYFKQLYDWVFIIHADDLPKKDWLPKMILGIESVKKRRVISVWSSYDVLNDTSGMVLPGRETIEYQFTEGNEINFKKYLTGFISSWHISGCAIHVENYFEVGGFDENLPQFGDLEFMLRSLKKGIGHYYLGDSLTIYRITVNSVSDISYRTYRDVKEMTYIHDKYKSSFTTIDSLRLFVRLNKLIFKRIIKSLLKKSYTGVKVGIYLLFNSFKLIR